MRKKKQYAAEQPLTFKIPLSIEKDYIYLIITGGGQNCELNLTVGSPQSVKFMGELHLQCTQLESTMVREI